MQNNIIQAELEYLQALALRRDLQNNPVALLQELTQIQMRVLAKIAHSQKSSVTSKVVSSNRIMQNQEISQTTVRVQAPQVYRGSQDIVNKQQAYSKAYELPKYVEEEEREEELQDIHSNSLDKLFFEAARYVVGSQRAYASSLQANYSIGQPRANRIITQLERAGIIGPLRNGKREILMTEYELENLLDTLNNSQNQVSPNPAPHPYHTIQNSQEKKQTLDNLGEKSAILDINEHLRASNSETLSENLSRGMAGSLSEVMSLNERFLLCNTLFRGDMQVFQNVLDKLNLARNRATAEQILAQVHKHYAWGENEADALAIFQQLLDKRFA